MRTTFKTISISVAITAMAILACHAQPRPHGFYIKGGLGPALVEDSEFKSFPGSAGNHDVDFDVGVRFDFGFGYQVVPWFAAEFETGATFSSIDSIDGAFNEDADVVNIPFMVNTIFQCPTMGRFVPYIGLGVGFSSTVLDVDDITIGSTSVFGGSEYDTVFAYQALAGFRYHIDRNWSVGASYKYMRTDEAEWDVHGFAGTDHIRLDALSTHSVTVDFTFNF